MTQPFEVSIIINKEEIDHGSYLKVTSRLMSLSSDPRSIHQMQGSLELSIIDYGSSIPMEHRKVGDFFRKIHKLWPYWAYFLSNENNSLFMALNLIGGVSAIKTAADGTHITTFHDDFDRYTMIDTAATMLEASAALRDCHGIKEKEMTRLSCMSYALGKLS